MTRLKIALLFISLFVLRWHFLQSPLPSGWTSESKIRYTVTVLEKPEYSDTATIVRNGIWYIRIKGYQEIIPGNLVRLEGVVEPKMILGKVTQIKMVEPTMMVMDRRAGERTSPLQKMIITLANWRERCVEILQKNLPEPMAGLSAGILLGVKGQMPSDFYQTLVSTGTLHIIAASGFNVSVVGAVLMKGAMIIVARGWAIGIGVLGILLYVLIAGGSASIVRAGIMGGLALIAYYLGRPAEARRLLWVTAGCMLFYNPLYIVDVGFQLSLMATAGLLYLEPKMKEILNLQFTIYNQISNIQFTRFLENYLYPTLAATITTLPIIWWHFGRISWISPLVNILVLPVVPLIMLLSALTLVGGQLVAWVAYVPLAYLVWVIRLLG